MIPNELKMTIEKALLMNPELKAEYDSNTQTKELIDMAIKLLISWSFPTQFRLYL